MYTELGFGGDRSRGVYIHQWINPLMISWVTVLLAGGSWLQVGYWGRGLTWKGVFLYPAPPFLFAAGWLKRAAFLHHALHHDVSARSQSTRDWNPQTRSQIKPLFLRVVGFRYHVSVVRKLINTPLYWVKESRLKMLHTYYMIQFVRHCRRDLVAMANGSVVARVMHGENARWCGETGMWELEDCSVS